MRSPVVAVVFLVVGLVVFTVGLVVSSGLMGGP